MLVMGLLRNFWEGGTFSSVLPEFSAQNRGGKIKMPDHLTRSDFIKTKTKTKTKD